MVQVAGVTTTRREPTTMKSLLEAGVHFGHQTRRWNPHMKRYIFTRRNGIHIIDLQQTLGLLEKAREAVTEIVADGGDILFVGTKKQAQESIESEARTLRHAFREPALVRRDAHQFPDHSLPNRLYGPARGKERKLAISR